MQTQRRSWMDDSEPYDADDEEEKGDDEDDDEDEDDDFEDEDDEEDEDEEQPALTGPNEYSSRPAVLSTTELVEVSWTCARRVLWCS